MFHFSLRDVIYLTGFVFTWYFCSDCLCKVGQLFSSKKASMEMEVIAVSWGHCLLTWPGEVPTLDGTATAWMCPGSRFWFITVKENTHTHKIKQEDVRPNIVCAQSKGQEKSCHSNGVQSIIDSCIGFWRALLWLPEMQIMHGILLYRLFYTLILSVQVLQPLPKVTISN